MKKLTNEEILCNCYGCRDFSELKDYMGTPVIDAMSQAVKQRDEEIKEWVSNHMTFDRLKSMKMVDSFELLQFLNQKP